MLHFLIMLPESKIKKNIFEVSVKYYNDNNQKELGNANNNI